MTRFYVWGLVREGRVASSVARRCGKTLRCMMLLESSIGHTKLTPPSCERMFCATVGFHDGRDDNSRGDPNNISFVLFLGASLGNALYALVPAAATRALKANKGGFTLAL